MHSHVCVPSPSRDVVCKCAHWDFRHCTLHHLRRLRRLWIATCVEVYITVIAYVFQVISLLQLCDVVALFGVLLVTAWRWWFSVAVCWGCDAVNLLRLCLDAWRLDTAKCGLVSQTSIFVCVCVKERGGGGWPVFLVNAVAANLTLCFKLTFLSWLLWAHCCWKALLSGYQLNSW